MAIFTLLLDLQLWKFSRRFKIIVLFNLFILPAGPREFFVVFLILVCYLLLPFDIFILFILFMMISSFHTFHTFCPLTLFSLFIFPFVIYILLIFLILFISWSFRYLRIWWKVANIFYEAMILVPGTRIHKMRVYFSLFIRDEMLQKDGGSFWFFWSFWSF